MTYFYSVLQIDADFEQLFGKCEKLFNDWEQFSEKFLKYVRSAEIKDDRSLQLLRHLQEAPVCQGKHKNIKIKT